MVDLRVRPEAEADLLNAFASYEQRRSGLGLQFLAVVNTAFERIAEMPEQFPIVHRDIRRALTKRFPFAVFFILEHETAVILAVLHQATDPARFRGRG